MRDLLTRVLFWLFDKGIASGMFGKEIHESLADGGVDPSEFSRVEATGNAVMSEVAETIQRMKGMVG